MLLQPIGCHTDGIKVSGRIVPYYVLRYSTHAGQKHTFYVPVVKKYAVFIHTGYAVTLGHPDKKVSHGLHAYYMRTYIALNTKPLKVWDKV